jgi:LmbE family N-acetylglucosaminyl deacetylase
MDEDYRYQNSLIMGDPEMFAKIVVLAPHIDDGELGCGGSIAKFVEEEKEIWYAAFSIAEDSIPKGFPKNVLETELKRATKILGVPGENVLVYRYKVRTFSYSRQEILDDLLTLKQEIKPDLIFSPSLNDVHQDHKVLAEEGRRMFKENTILGYEEPWNNISFDTISFVPLKERHIQKKIDALMCYESQKCRKYLNEEFIRGLAKVRGTQIKKEYAEAFEVIRWIL